MTLRSLHPTELCSLKAKARKLLEEIRRDEQLPTSVHMSSSGKRADEVIHALLTDLGMADIAERHQYLSKHAW